MAQNMRYGAVNHDIKLHLRVCVVASNVWAFAVLIRCAATNHSQQFFKVVIFSFYQQSPAYVCHTTMEVERESNLKKRLLIKRLENLPSLQSVM